MFSILRKPRARADLLEIWNRTVETWGEAQADAYLDDIGCAIETLAEFPKMGVDCSWLRNGYRRLSVNHHLVFYQVVGDTIEIIRVLHERTDVERHLEE